MLKKSPLTAEENNRRAFSRGYHDGLADKEPMLISPTAEYCKGYEHGQKLAELHHRAQIRGNDRPTFLPLPVVRE